MTEHVQGTVHILMVRRNQAGFKAMGMPQETDKRLYGTGQPQEQGIEEEALWQEGESWERTAQAGYEEAVHFPDFPV